MTDTTPHVALITGASRGLGAALAEALAPTHHIVAVGKTTGALEELDDRIQAAGGQATLAPMDITVEPAMQQLCRSIFDRWGKLDLWVHAAVHAANEVHGDGNAEPLHDGAAAAVVVGVLSIRALVALLVLKLFESQPSSTSRCFRLSFSV